jgi:multidrug efflux pump subunit AcrA (membrane-fusion protein)
MVLFLQKVWVFIKTYWQIIFGFVLAVVLGVLFRKREQSWSDRYREIQEQRDLEIKKINDARAQERAAHEAAQKQLQVTLDEVQKQYDAAKKQLDDAKKAEIARIVTKYSDDPEGLARELAAVTGFTIQLPTSSENTP